VKKGFLFVVFTLIVAFASSGAYSEEVTLLGPSQFDRTKGAPNVYRESFPAVAGEATLVVVNGGASRKSRVSSAVIAINGQIAVRPKDLSKKVERIELELPVLDSNTIEVTLRSKPGSYLTVSLVQDIPVELEAGMPGLGLEAPDRLLLALPVKNTGAGTAFDVEVTAATLEVAGSPVPFTLPTALGDIGGGGSSVFEASFPSDDLGSGQEHLLTVAGTYLVGGGGLTLDYAFEKTLLIPQRAPGSATLNTASVEGVFVTGAPYPPENPGPVEIPEGYNEEEVPPVPTGQLRGTLSPENSLTGFGPPTPASAKRGRAPTAAAVPLKDTDPVLFFTQINSQRAPELGSI
jgi:hypothetical protein